MSTSSRPETPDTSSGRMRTNWSPNRVPENSNVRYGSNADRQETTHCRQCFTRYGAPTLAVREARLGEGRMRLKATVARLLACILLSITTGTAYAARPLVLVCEIANANGTGSPYSMNLTLDET